MTQGLLLNDDRRHDGWRMASRRYRVDDGKKGKWVLISHDSAAAQQEDHILCNGMTRG